MKLKVFTLLMLFLVIPYTSSADDTEVKAKYESGFNEMEQIIAEMQENGFKTVRLNDTLKAARQIYEGQLNIKTASLRDFTLVDSYFEEIRNLKEQGYIAKDEIAYVYGVRDEIKRDKPEIDLSEAESIIEEMQFEFDSERYDEAYSLAKEAYSKLTELEGQYTALNLAYKTTTQTLRSFFVEHWIMITIISVSAIIIFLILKNRLRIMYIKHKIKKLDKESGVLEDLIKTTQKKYFEQNEMPESTYRIRIKKFSELMRDINRQIPLLREELAKRKKSDKGRFSSEDLSSGGGKRVEKVKYGETRVHSNRTKGPGYKKVKKKDKGVKAPIKERKVQVAVKKKKSSKQKAKKKK